MSDERIDLSPLDLDPDSERFHNLVGRIVWRARGELHRRAMTRPLTPVEMVAAWYRPALTAAAAIAVISLTLLATAGRKQEEVQAGAYMSGTEVPTALTNWYENGSSPTAAELLVANGGGH